MGLPPVLRPAVTAHGGDHDLLQARHLAGAAARLVSKITSGEPPRPLVPIDAEEVGDFLRGVSVVDALDGETTAVIQDCGGARWFSCGSIMRTTS